MVKAGAENKIELNRKSSFSVFGHPLLFFNQSLSLSIFFKFIIDSFQWSVIFW